MEKPVDPKFYNREYFLADNEGWREYKDGLNGNIHPKFRRALEIANVSKGDRVLDAGCGRGELIYYCAKRGARVLGIDYSKAAIEIARETIRRLSDELQPFARAEVGDVATFEFSWKYDIIFMIEIAEHMYDWQLERSFEKIKGLLSDRGRLIIMTPNYYYEKYLSPIKRIINIPFDIIKWPLRAIRGKYRPNGISKLMGKIFRIKVDRGELNKKLHVNITTPAKLKKLLADFDVTIRCEDHSRNIASVITRKWFGREIVAIAKNKK